MQIYHILKSAKWNANNITGFKRYSVIDIPFSKDAYDFFFKRNILKLANLNSDKISQDLTISELDPVLGKNWHILTNSKTTTIQRELGMVSMIYRKKEVDFQRMINR